VPELNSFERNINGRHFVSPCARFRGDAGHSIFTRRQVSTTTTGPANDSGAKIAAGPLRSQPSTIIGFLFPLPVRRKYASLFLVKDPTPVLLMKVIYLGGPHATRDGIDRNLRWGGGHRWLHGRTQNVG
jgi:hypothetical protein